MPPLITQRTPPPPPALPHVRASETLAPATASRTVRPAVLLYRNAAAAAAKSSPTRPRARSLRVVDPGRACPPHPRPKSSPVSRVHSPPDIARPRPPGLGLLAPARRPVPNSHTAQAPPLTCACVPSRRTLSASAEVGTASPKDAASASVPAATRKNPRKARSPPMGIVKTTLFLPPWVERDALVPADMVIPGSNIVVGP
jgi:hypothetical protein